MLSSPSSPSPLPTTPPTSRTIKGNSALPNGIELPIAGERRRTKTSQGEPMSSPKTHHVPSRDVLAPASAHPLPPPPKSSSSSPRKSEGSVALPLGIEHIAGERRGENILFEPRGEPTSNSRPQEPNKPVDSDATVLPPSAEGWPVLTLSHLLGICEFEHFDLPPEVLAGGICEVARALLLQVLDKYFASFGVDENTNTYLLQHFKLPLPSLEASQEEGACYDVLLESPWEEGFYFFTSIELSVLLAECTCWQQDLQKAGHQQLPWHCPVKEADEVLALEAKLQHHQHICRPLLHHPYEAIYSYSEEDLLILALTENYKSKVLPVEKLEALSKEDLLLFVLSARSKQFGVIVMPTPAPTPVSGGGG